MTVSPKGYCGDHCDILEWGGALRGGVFTDPGATSGGQVPPPPFPPPSSFPPMITC